MLVRSAQWSACLVLALFLTLAASVDVWAQGASLPEVVTGGKGAWPAFLKAFKITDPSQIKSVPEIVVGVLNVVLGFLGLFFVILLTYSGFLWMTAAGDEKKVRTAQQYLSYGIIGILVIIAAWAIANFVITAITGVVY